MPPERAHTFETAPYEELFAVLLRQLKRPLKTHGFDLNDDDAAQLAGAVTQHRPDTRRAPLLAGLTAVIAESEGVLKQWGLSFQQALDVKMDAMPGWETTAEFLELANEKSNAELRIVIAAAWALLLDERRWLPYLLYLAAGHYDDETVIARRALACASGSEPSNADWFAQIRLWAQQPTKTQGAIVEQLQRLRTLLGRVADLKGAGMLLGWDQRTYMPAGGVQGRADQAATLAGLAHEFFTADEVGQLLDDLDGQFADYDSDEASLVRIMRRDYRKLKRIPSALLMEVQQVGAHARQAWQNARTQNDFALFQPHLEKMLALQRQLAETLNSSADGQPFDNLYSALLDRFEPGMTYERIDEIFSGLKKPLVALVQAINAKVDAVSDEVLRRHYPRERQLAFGQMLAQALGYDFQRGRLDLSAHPFTSGIHRDDVRITTRVNEDYVLVCLGSSIHETGHALHRQNLSPALYRSNLESTGLATAETLSRYYENIVGLSREFWQYAFPKAQEFFPHLADCDLETWYRAINKSFPSLIRTDADEVTYGLHIILRFELENELINGRLKVADLPKVWNERMEAYLGVVPPTNSDGVLQDIHWSQGGWGYFPDYLLGTIFASQLDAQLMREQPQHKAAWTRGEFGGVLRWLTDKIMAHGGKFTFAELAERATGTPFSWQPYMAYLQQKYGDIYGL
ncbi:MAG: carboxypeptidase M32 [Chloroflexi bacterium]|nr:carboxypeptidase M32 [Chloroflexota bacterium]